MAPEMITKTKAEHSEAAEPQNVILQGSPPNQQAKRKTLDLNPNNLQSQKMTTSIITLNS
ncbi:hypothetical protein Vi05172_g6761 [Venturia inaequalis]|nr:hypothetical protein Vi05172_g6761 [Venturia inaequalis]